MSLAPPLHRARKKAGAVAVRSFFKGAARAARGLPIARPEWHDVVVTRDVPYLGTGLAAHTYDVWRPRSATGRLPLCFYVHGGAFRALSKDTHWIMGLAFARRGMAVCLPNYRLAPQHRYPAAHEDAALALRHVVDHADHHGVDRDCVVVAGESAGANIAVGLTVGKAWQRDEPHLRPIVDVDIKAVVAACGVFQVGNPDRFSDIDPDFHWFYRDRCQELQDFLPLRNGVPHDDELASPWGTPFRRGRKSCSS